MVRYSHGMEWHRGEYILSDDKARLDVPAIKALLRATYWASDRTDEQFERVIKHSVCFGLYHRGRQVGFARVLTDFAVFAYLGDVIVAPEHRGQGLGKWMVECILTHPALDVTTQCLSTRDAHSLYERYGFQRSEYLRRSKRDRTEQT
jgi:GNAT superfamily N-acetyltransferase